MTDRPQVTTDQRHLTTTRTHVTTNAPELMRYRPQLMATRRQLGNCSTNGEIKCCYNNELKNGSCHECPDGYYIVKVGVGPCTKCRQGNYGYACSRTCTCTEHEICHPVNGSCMEVSTSGEQTSYNSTQTSPRQTEVYQSTDNTRPTNYINTETDIPEENITFSNREIVIYTLGVVFLLMILGMTTCARKCNKRRKKAVYINDTAPDVPVRRPQGLPDHPYHDIYDEIDERLMTDDEVDKTASYLDVVDSVSINSTAQLPVAISSDRKKDTEESSSGSAMSSTHSHDKSGYLRPQVTANKEISESDSSSDSSSVGSDVNRPQARVSDGYLLPISSSKAQKKTLNSVMPARGQDGYLNPYQPLEMKDDQINDYDGITDNHDQYKKRNIDRLNSNQLEINVIVHSEQSDSKQKTDTLPNSKLNKSDPSSHKQISSSDFEDTMCSTERINKSAISDTDLYSGIKELFS